MNQIVAQYLVNPLLCLTPTDRLIFLTLAERLAGMRIAATTGSKYRWVARQISKVAQNGILCRVAPRTYALGERAESRPRAGRGRTD